MTTASAIGVQREVHLVTRAKASFGYGRDGQIREIRDALPAQYWKHPANAWSPLIRSRIPELGGAWIKYEGGHVTGFFKDRIMAVTLGELMARTPDCPGVVVPSSGNAAVSAAAFCAQRGLPMVAIVPEATPQERIRPVLARGGVVLRAGEGPSASYSIADKLAETLGFFKLYSTFASPWAEWGCRSLGREICGQLANRPGMVVAPVSAGPVLVGAGNGILEGGGQLPILVAVQSAGCAPIAEAYANNSDKVTPWTVAVDTKAVAIADRLVGYPQDGTRVLSMVRRSAGEVAAVTDAEMAEARAALFTYDGIDAELSACAAVAWVLRRGGAIPADTVCLVTASGFKHTFAGDVPGPHLAEQAVSTLAKIESFLKQKGIDASVMF